MIEKHADRPRAITLGPTRGSLSPGFDPGDTSDFVNELRSMNVRPHVARRLRGSAIDRRTTRHPGYGTSQRIRKRIEEAFGWMKTVGSMRRPMRSCTERVGWSFTFAAAAYNLVRLPKLLTAAAQFPRRAPSADGRGVDRDHSPAILRSASHLSPDRVLQQPARAVETARIVLSDPGAETCFGFKVSRPQVAEAVANETFAGGSGIGVQPMLHA